MLKITNLPRGQTSTLQDGQNKTAQQPGLITMKSKDSKSNTSHKVIDSKEQFSIFIELHIEDYATLLLRLWKQKLASKIRGVLM